jgi:hypothetical protein
MSDIFALGRKLRGEEPLFPEKGGKGGGDNGAGAQADALKQSTQLQRDQWNTIMNNLAPFTPLAQQYVSQLQGLSTLQGQNSALNDYYKSSQYKGLADQARYQTLAGAEATGGLGSTATSNQLATIAPTLGQNWLSGQMQNAFSKAVEPRGVLARRSIALRAGSLSYILASRPYPPPTPINAGLVTVPIPIIKGIAC